MKKNSQYLHTLCQTCARDGRLSDLPCEDFHSSTLIRVKPCLSTPWSSHKHTFISPSPPPLCRERGFIFHGNFRSSFHKRWVHFLHSDEIRKRRSQSQGVGRIWSGGGTRLLSPDQGPVSTSNARAPPARAKIMWMPMMPRWREVFRVLGF